MIGTPPESITRFVTDEGLFARGVPLFAEPLTGGVSSEIWLVHDGRRRVVVKTPLATLRVAEVWTAPLERSDAEAGWLEVATRLVPGFCPDVLAYDADRHLLAISYLDPLRYRLWKQDLLGGRVDVHVAALLGQRVGVLHRLSAAQPALAERFANEEMFRALRTEPYFGAVGRRHPDLAGPLAALVADTSACRTALVHGDVSPKNILVGPRGPVLLDAEAACWGDPAFDVAFCVNHLLLKALLPRLSVDQLIDAANALSEAYLEHVHPSERAELQRRVAALLPALMLARVDGRSPVDYLIDPAQAVVRGFARTWIRRPAGELSELTASWKAAVT